MEIIRDIVCQVYYDGITLAEAYLKRKLNSDIGVITFFNPAEYENGLDFEIKYQY